MAMERQDEKVSTSRRITHRAEVNGPSALTAKRFYSLPLPLRQAILDYVSVRPEWERDLLSFDVGLPTHKP